MNFKLYKNFGALNSVPVFAALEQGLRNSGHRIVNQDEDVSVIWSVLWHGRMAGNKKIFDENRIKNRKTLIVEVGNLFRGTTWRLSTSHINADGFYGNHQNLDPDRPYKLGINYKPPQHNRANKILIACQHDKSLQWDGMPSMSDWVNQTIKEIRKVSDRPIDVRPHPRSPLKGSINGAEIITPKLIQGTYDDFDINYNYHCVINHNSGPCVQAAINGVPIICHTSSLAYEVSDTMSNIEKISLPERTNWLIKLCHTEWTLQEIAEGLPIQRIFY